MSKYYIVKEVVYSALESRCGTESERGLDEKCESEFAPKGQHAWLMFPEWSEGVQEGGKAYCMCLNCLQHSHL
jgi:hypothetical protein